MKQALAVLSFELPQRDGFELRAQTALLLFFQTHQLLHGLFEVAVLGFQVAEARFEHRTLFEKWRK